MCFRAAQLLNAVWGYTHDGYEHTVTTHINRLRAKLEADPMRPELILTVRGAGYKMRDAAVRPMTVRLKLALTIFATGLVTALLVIAAVIYAFQRFEHEIDVSARQRIPDARRREQRRRASSCGARRRRSSGSGCATSCCSSPTRSSICSTPTARCSRPPAGQARARASRSR